MKLAIVTPYPPSKVALKEYAFHLAKSFAQKEAIEELILLTDRTDKPKNLSFTTAGCWVKVKQCWSLDSYTNVVSVIRALNKTKPNAVLFNLQFTNFGNKKVATALGLLLPAMCKWKKIPTIVLLHNTVKYSNMLNNKYKDNVLLQKGNNLLSAFYERLLLQANEVVFTLQKNVDDYKNIYKNKNISLIPHGTFYIPEVSSNTEFEGTLQVLAFGKFGINKKVDRLIEAIEKIRYRRNIDVEIVIAGTDSDEVTGYLENVKELYANVPKLKFTGYVEDYEVPAIFNRSTVVVLPYVEYGGSSEVLHITASYGKAMVVPNIGDFRDKLAQEGFLGEFYETDSVDSMAEAIESLLLDEEYRAQQETANALAARVNPMDKVTDMYMERFYKMLSSKKEQPVVKKKLKTIKSISFLK
ncbi:glycosyl transferase family 1 [Neptunitalea chrysea]|uniref:Glycosyl transferase family 1 n=1 Tax=Neptunitalea chrysea TaxID=1647581 RepID=A0A9W6B7T3_9FLAO|nr:glycosyltransferase [Neptunitalea chrysea]GLB53432.1 glycosyl transferase family 1 [Neptunitalea chrysea]